MKQLFTGLALLITVALNAQTTPVILSKFVVQKSTTGVTAYWTTTSESNCDHFDFQGSSDGINFVTLGKQNSYVASGNSAVNHDYILAVTYTTQAGVGFLLVLVALSLAFSRVRRKAVFVTTMIAFVTVISFSCKKSSDAVKKPTTYSIFRLGQVDKDGVETFYFPKN